MNSLKGIILYMSRLLLITLTSSLVVLTLTGFYGFHTSTEMKNMRSSLTDLSSRVESIEAVYESSECVLTTESDGGCTLGDGSQLFLGEPDRDGEIRILRLVNKEGKESETGLLSSDASYVRIKNSGGSLEGFMSDASTGRIEVYASRPSLSVIDEEERLPVMIKSLLKKEDLP